MRRARRTIRRRLGLTLVELLTGVVIALLLCLCAGILLADSQKNYQRVFTQVAGDGTTDGFAAIRAFDSICRKASKSRCALGTDEQLLEVYLYSAPEVSFPDRYARFYASGSDLLLEQGGLEPYRWTKNRSGAETIVLARGLERVRFRKDGEALQMLLTFENPENPGTVVCSAVRHSE